MHWKRDGDLHVALGRRGAYRITVWKHSWGSNFCLAVYSGEHRVSLGEFRSMARAKQYCERYDLLTTPISVD